MFCLQTARRSGNLSFVFKAMEKLPGSSDFLVNIPQYVGEEVFGLAKRRLYVEPRADDDSHHIDKIKFSHPKTPAKTLRTRLHDSPLAYVEHDLEVDFLALPAET